ncbi:VOC family protein [Actinomycetospora lemnae]|uniref:VOC family protein n=1 Tax=Actinomycetospora lemnae TaxID=3019891 RepID=A0ABT5SMS3_9PSEU|nr:VOC family protein [Actinomycetospora sp. DW7H6]MDD7964140.1 VOC family protein [Actinomycetospora sp. DW7H6]
MIAVDRVNVWVHDQQVACAFWTEKVGFELRADATFPELAGFRWLTVGPPGGGGPELVLMAIPEPPVVTREQSELIRAVTSQGLGGAIFLATDDVRRDHALLAARGVEFTEEPEARPYGLDAGFRDPSGNQVRLTQTVQDGGTA